MATQIASIDDRYVEKWRKELAPFETRLVFLNAPHSAKTSQVGEFPKKTLVRFKKQSFGKAEIHANPMSKNGPTRHDASGMEDVNAIGRVENTYVLVGTLQVT
ncbi:MAG: hypothetical protein ACOVLE_10320 [Pirellula staleyi]